MPSISGDYLKKFKWRCSRTKLNTGAEVPQAG